jgi:hypothetical protein
MVYLLKALIGDLPWFYTPKASKALLRQRLFIENAVALTLITSGAALLILGHVILAVYILLNSALIIAGYRIGTIKPMGKVNVRALIS